MLEVCYVCIEYVLFVFIAAMALECYSCKSSKVSSKSGALASIFSRKAASLEEDRACNEAGIFDIGSIKTATCGPNQVCGNLRASLTFREKITGAGKNSTYFIFRRCTGSYLPNCIPCQIWTIYTLFQK